MHFAEAEKRYRSLDDAYQRGHLSDQDYQAAVKQIRVQDESGRAWKIQVYSGQWHMFQAGVWQPAEPPVDNFMQHVEQDKPSTVNNWFILRNGEKLGPYQWDQLIQISSDRGIYETDRVWTETYADWMAVSELPALKKYIRQPVVVKKSNKKKRNYILLIAAVLTIICVSVFVVFSGFFTLLLFGSQGPTSGSLSLGDMQVMTVTSVGVEGSQIKINNAAAELDGMTIEVPQGAYLGDLNFTIGETPILSHSFGEDFTPASPLITIDNGQVFAHEPLTLTIPIQKTDDEFAMGFYYDRQTGELEGIPFISQTNQEIVLYTAHFSDIVISTVQKGRIVDEIDTGFSPGTDDFQMRNYGTYLSPNGHCAGQSIAAIYYYNNIKTHGELRISQQVPLWGRFDNQTHITGAEITPKLFWDDSSVIRLSSALQYYMSNRWNDDSPIRIDSPEHALFTYKDYIGNDDELTYYAFVYAMQMTREPQLIYIAQSRNIVKPGAEPAAHVMIAYRISGNKIYVADPNFEGDSNKFVELERFFHPISFKFYNSGLNAFDTSLFFDRFGYFGVSALVDERVIAHYWQEVISGSVVGQELFPDDVQIEIAVDMDEYDKIIFTDLVDGLVLSADGIARVDPQDRVLLRIKEPDPADRIRVYFGDDYENYFEDQYLWLNLSTGEHDIGIGHFRLSSVDSENYHFVNFSRYRLIYQQAGESMPIIEYRDFDARLLIEGAMKRLGVQERLTDLEDICHQGYCQFSTFVPDENTGASSAMQLAIQETSGPTSYADWGHIERHISFIEERENISFITKPTAFNYRGVEAYTYQTLRVENEYLSVIVINNETISLFGPNWYLEITGQSSCENKKVDGSASICEPEPIPSLYLWIDAILDEGFERGMFQ